ncbi:MAG: hypothetical protein KDK30_13390, partial [Leptospiraceae bacterium]|nr:hypothetical protein [Leptospiraceae bacterium]
MQGILGILVFCGIAWVVSEKRGTINWRVLFGGLVMQFTLAIVLIKFPPIAAKIALLNEVVQALDRATMAGTSFIFGYLGGGQLPFENITGNPGSTFILAFRALPLVMVVSALTSLLFYWKVLPYIVRGFAFILRKSLGIGGAEGLGSAANIFVGMVEAPLFIKPYMNRLNRSELFVIMTAGMATIAGTMMVIYAYTIAPLFEGEYALETAGPGALGHLLIASLLSAPASIVI